jgi:copper chaperone CopZ
VQPAQKQLKGVKEAQVLLEKKGAVVKFDPDVVTVEDLIKALKNARGIEFLRRESKKDMTPGELGVGLVGRQPRLPAPCYKHHIYLQLVSKLGGRRSPRFVHRCASG